MLYWDMWCTCRRIKRSNLIYAGALKCAIHPKVYYMPGTGFVNETSTPAIELVVLKPHASLNFHI